MKAKIRITTWPKGQSQGSMLPIIICDMEVNTKYEQMVRREGCSSLEIVQESSVTTVMLNGRKFVCDKPWGTDLSIGVDYCLAIPWELAELLKKCPHCGALL
jgi:hypothetical protein